MQELVSEKDQAVLRTNRAAFEPQREFVPGPAFSAAFQARARLLPFLTCITWRSRASVVLMFSPLHEDMCPCSQCVCRSAALCAARLHVHGAFSAAMQARSDVFRATRAKLDAPFDKSQAHPGALMKSEYGVPGWEAVKANMWRERLLLTADRQSQVRHVLHSARQIVSAIAWPCTALALRQVIA